MSTHEGVSCDSCMASNFAGKRFKCLICFDYDLCASCYQTENLSSPSRHTTLHPMQCILTKTDFEIFYGSDFSSDQPQSFTCPYCGKLGFVETTLLEHVSNEHTNITYEVICPICAAVPRGDPNLLTDDFVNHLTVMHPGNISNLGVANTPPEPVVNRSNATRNVPRRQYAVRGRRYAPSQNAATPTTNDNFLDDNEPLAFLPDLSRDMDPIAELMSYLTISATGTDTNTPSTIRSLRNRTTPTTGSNRFGFLPPPTTTVTTATSDSASRRTRTRGGTSDAPISSTDRTFNARLAHLRMLERDLMDEEIENERLLRERNILHQMRQQLERLPRGSRAIDVMNLGSSLAGTGAKTTGSVKGVAELKTNALTTTVNSQNEEVNSPYILDNYDIVAQALSMKSSTDSSNEDSNSSDSDLDSSMKSLFLQDILLSTLTFPVEEYDDRLQTCSSETTLQSEVYETGSELSGTKSF